MFKLILASLTMMCVACAVDPLEERTQTEPKRSAATRGEQGIEGVAVRKALTTEEKQKLCEEKPELEDCKKE